MEEDHSQCCSICRMGIQWMLQLVWFRQIWGSGWVELLLSDLGETAASGRLCTGLVFISTEGHTCKRWSAVLVNLWNSVPRRALETRLSNIVKQIDRFFDIRGTKVFRVSEGKWPFDKGSGMAYWMNGLSWGAVHPSCFYYWKEWISLWLSHLYWENIIPSHRHPYKGKLPGW